jgi:hypothetical protein
MAVFGPEKNILKTMMFRDVTTVLNERKHLEMVTVRTLGSEYKPFEYIPVSTKYILFAYFCHGTDFSTF